MKHQKDCFLFDSKESVKLYDQKFLVVFKNTGEKSALLLLLFQPS